VTGSISSQLYVNLLTNLCQKCVKSDMSAFEIEFETMENENKKRKRSKNFTEREKENLIEIVSDNVKILENKKTNSVFNKMKQECWNTKIANAYNSTQTSGVRTGEQLKSLYEQMKKCAKNNKSNDKVKFKLLSDCIHKEKLKFILGTKTKNRWWDF
jgi:hypothetical protein